MVVVVAEEGTAAVVAVNGTEIVASFAICCKIAVVVAAAIERTALFLVGSFVHTRC